MSKIIKKRTSYNISESILNKFNEISEKNAMNKSKLIEILIDKWIKEQENDINKKN